MGFKTYDSCGDTTSTTGTGTLTGTGSPPNGYQSPASAGVVDGDSLVIRIETQDGTTWEDCESVYTVSTKQYTRGNLLASSTGSRVSFTGTLNIKITASSTMLRQGVLSMGISYAASQNALGV
jgi:hypothetical protein